MTSRWHWALFGGGSTIAFLAVLFGQLPATIYAGNESQFSWPIRDLLWIYVPASATLIATATLLCAILPQRLARALATILACTAVVAWINGSFFSYDFGLLDGQSWKIAAPAWIIALELCAGALAAALVAIALKSKPQAAALFLGAMTASAMTPVLTVSSAKEPPAPADISELTRFSPDKNVLVVLLDGMQSDVFEDAVAANPDIKGALEGFTHFIDTAGVAQTTYMTIPAIHSGQEYRPGDSIKGWYADSVKTGSFVTRLTEAGYKSAMINPVLGICPEKSTICTSAGTLFAGPTAGLHEQASSLANMSLLRIAPFPLKAAVYNGGKWVLSFAKADPRTEHFSVEGNSFMREVAQTMSVTSSAPTVKFYHLFSTHLPIVLDESCAYVGETKNSRAGHLNQAACGLRAFATLLDALKQNGIYDKTAIVLLSDHGSGGWGNPRSIESRSLRAGLRSVANPTLAVKPIGAAGAFTTSHKPVSIAGVAPTVCHMTGDCRTSIDSLGSVLSDTRTTGASTRRFNSYKWKAEYWTSDAIPNLTTYQIEGPVQVAESWRKLDPMLISQVARHPE